MSLVATILPRDGRPAPSILGIAARTFEVVFPQENNSAHGQEENIGLGEAAAKAPRTY